MFTIDLLNIFINIWLKPMLILLVVLSIAKNSFVFSASSNHWFLTSSLFAVVFSLIAWCSLPSIQVSLLPQSIVPLTQAAVSLESFTSTLTYSAMALYILGVVWVAFYQLFGLIEIRLITAAASDVTDQEYLNELNEIKRNFEIEKEVGLKTSSDMNSPVMWGHWAPVILLPQDFESWNSDRRKRVLAHEVAHIKRNDWLLKLVSKCVCAVFWLVPLAWYVANRLEWYAELATDDEVVEKLDCRAAYAKDLMDLSSEGNKSSWVLNLIRSSDLFIRIQHVLDGRNLRRPVHAIIKCIQVFGACVFVLPLSLLHAVPAPKTIDFKLYDHLIVYVGDKSPSSQKNNEPPEAIVFPDPYVFKKEDVKTFVAIPELPKFEEQVLVHGDISLSDVGKPTDVGAQFVKAEEIRHIPDETVVSPSVNIKGVIPQTMATPVYPRRAIERGIEGVVMVQFDIDEEGGIKNPNIVVSQPKRIFDRAVLKALKKSHYRPMVIEGQATRIKNVTETYYFRYQ